MEKKINTPALRFRGFNGPWEKEKFGDLVTLERGGSPRPIDDYITNAPDGLNWVKIGDAPEHGNYITHTAEKIRPEGLSKTRQVFPGDLILSNSMSFGRPYIMAISGCIHDGWLRIADENHHFDLKYLCTMLGTPAMLAQYRASAAGSTVNNLNKDLVGNTKVVLPSIAEQKCVGTFLDNFDNLIYLNEQKIKKLEQFRQAMLEKLFPREGATEPELRFRGFSGAWCTQQLKKIATKSGQRNFQRQYTETLTNSAEFGVISQKDYFEHDISNEANIDGYFVVENDDFVYNPRISVTAPVGPVNRNRLGRTGIMSPLYLVFKTHDVDRTYLEWYFKTRAWHSFMKFHGDTGARADRFAIKESLFFEMPIPCPTLEEQQKIGTFLDELDTYIVLQKKKLEQLERLKAALLDKLFV